MLRRPKCCKKSTKKSLAGIHCPSYARAGAPSVPFLCICLIFMATIEKPIGKWVFNVPQSRYHTRLKCLYVDFKQVRTFWKAQGRFVEIHTGDGIWFELTGNSRQDVSTKARNYVKGKAGTFKQLTIKSSSFYSGGKLLNLNPVTGNGHVAPVWIPMATTNPEFGQFLEVTVKPRRDIGDLRQCVHTHRVDAVGIVKGKNVIIPNKKAEVWLQGLDRTEILLELWGHSFVNLLSRMEVDTTVLQERAFAVKWVRISRARGLTVCLSDDFQRSLT